MHRNLKWSALIQQELLQKKFTKPNLFSAEGQGLPGGDAEVPPTPNFGVLLQIWSKTQKHYEFTPKFGAFGLWL